MYLWPSPRQTEGSQGCGTPRGHLANFGHQKGCSIVFGTEIAVVINWMTHMNWLSSAIACSTLAFIGLAGTVRAYTPPVPDAGWQGDRIAQTDLQLVPNIDLSRAKNLARQAAEAANGGLSRYRAEPSMHGPVTESPYIVNADGSWTFTFQGGTPGSADYTVESVVTVTPTGQVTVDYNGPVRLTFATPSAPVSSAGTVTTLEDGTTLTTVETNIDLSRAKNLARQAAEQANGGLSQYRAENSMHGPASESPYVTNPDGSWTFTFLGGTPGSDNYTMESEVTVTPTGTVTIAYNGPVR